jgi:hypothetical protein
MKTVQTARLLALIGMLALTAGCDTAPPATTGNSSSSDPAQSYDAVSGGAPSSQASEPGASGGGPGLVNDDQLAPRQGTTDPAAGSNQ